jgi:hypothetical protein
MNRISKLAAILALSVFSTGAFGQGTVVFANGPTTLISYAPTGTPQTLPASPVGSYYFGLLISASANGPFVFTGVYATNTVKPGRFGAASYTPTVPGWAPGATMFYEVAGWSATMGTVFQQAWLPFPTNTFGFFGMSPVASGVAGGSYPPTKLWVSISGLSVVVSWTGAGGTLQSSAALGAGEAWSAVGTANPATVTISSNARFFRVVPDAYPVLPLFGGSGLSGFSLLPPPI